MSEPVIVLDKLTKSYGKRRAMENGGVLTVLHSLSMRVRFSALSGRMARENPPRSAP